jgi:flagellar assembly protein FliH
MSSKIFADAGSVAASRPLWRQVQLQVESAAGPALPEQDFAATIENLQQDCERRVSEARSSGLREGEAAGRRAAAGEIQPVIDRLSRTVEDLSQLRPRLRHEAEADVLRLALAIARRVLRREMAVDPEALHGLVLAALEKIGSQEVSRVRVHPADAAQVAAGLRKTATGSSIEIVSDPARETGTVLFETERGNLDCSIESQLQEIERGLADRLRRQS